MKSRVAWLLVLLASMIQFVVGAATTTTISDYFTVDTRWSYEVRFHANGDEDYPVEGIMPNQYFYFGEEKALISNKFYRVGFKFGGWVEYPNQIVKKYGDAEIVKDIADEDGEVVDLYALWIPKVVKISFDANASFHDFLGSTHYFTVGRVFQQLPCSVYTTRKGIDFDGWYTHPVGGTKLIVGKTRVPATDCTYYGHWIMDAPDPLPEYDDEGRSYRVLFDPNGGTIADNEQARVVASGTEIGTLPAAEKEGYDLVGWYTALVGGERIAQSMIVLNNMTCFARWRECPDSGDEELPGGSACIRNVTARQRFPWNGLVDIKCDVSGVEGLTNQYKFVVAAVMPDSGAVREVSPLWVVRNGVRSTDLTVTADGRYRLLWDAQADLGQVCYDDMVVRVTLEVQSSVARDKVQLWEGGPYWATMNVGAEKPEDYGYYFWWGDTVGYKWENEFWVASDGSTTNFSFTSSNTLIENKDVATLQSNGWITAEGVLAHERDAAHEHWGGAWRMPTKVELNDLANNCDWTWTTLNGVNGYVVRGRDAYSSASIFLPAAGYGHGTWLNDAGSNGNFWSSVPFSDYLAWRLYFFSDIHNVNGFGTRRGDGRSVRAVQGFTE